MHMPFVSFENIKCRKYISSAFMFRIFFQAERIDKLTETLYPIDLNGEDRTILFNVWKIGDRFLHFLFDHDVISVY